MKSIITGWEEHIGAFFDIHQTEAAHELWLYNWDSDCVYVSSSANMCHPNPCFLRPCATALLYLCRNMFQPWQGLTPSLQAGLWVYMWLLWGVSLLHLHSNSSVANQQLRVVKKTLWTGCKALAWHGLVLCFSLCYHQREKGIISVLPYKQSAAMQRPEGTTNTHRLAQKAPAGSRSKCVWSPAESSDIKGEERRGEMKRSVGKIHKVSGTHEEGGGEAVHF